MSGIYTDEEIAEHLRASGYTSGGDTIDRLLEEVRKLRAAMRLTYCAYCGASFPAEKEGSAELVGAHIAACPKHPMRVVEAERDAAIAEREDLEDAVDALKRIGDVIGCDHTDGKDDRARLVQCVRSEFSRIKTEWETLWRHVELCRRLTLWDFEGCRDAVEALEPGNDRLSVMVIDLANHMLNVKAKVEENKALRAERDSAVRERDALVGACVTREWPDPRRTEVAFGWQCGVSGGSAHDEDAAKAKILAYAAKHAGAAS